MSRSYKHTPRCGDKKGRYSKRLANHVVRRNRCKDAFPQYAGYKKMFESWNICDYEIVGISDWFIDAIECYAAIHCDNIEVEVPQDIKEIEEYLSNYTFSATSVRPTKLKQLTEVYPMSRTILKFRGVERHPFCYSTSAFTRREDRATLGSDLSALRGLAKGAGFIQVNPLLLPLENKSDKPG